MDAAKTTAFLFLSILILALVVVPTFGLGYLYGAKHWDRAPGADIDYHIYYKVGYEVQTFDEHWSQRKTMPGDWQWVGENTQGLGMG